MYYHEMIKPINEKLLSIKNINNTNPTVNGDNINVDDNSKGKILFLKFF